MKLATLRDGSRDGHLAVVSRDLSQAHYASGIASRLQQLLDDWNFVSPQLEDLYATLNGGKSRHAFPFDARQCMAPLPRAYQWQCAAGGGTGPLAAGASDHFLGACDDAVFSDVPSACEPTLVAAIGDLAQASSAEQALDGVRLLMLAAVWDAESSSPDDAGASWARSLPAPSFAPLAITPEEIGSAWRAGRARLALHGGIDSSAELTTAPPNGGRSLGELIAQIAVTRPLRAGSLVGRGYGARLGRLAFGGTLRIDAIDGDGLSTFGPIAARIVALDAGFAS